MSKLQQLLDSPTGVDQAIQWIGGAAIALAGFATVVFAIAILLERF